MAADSSAISIRPARATDLPDLAQLHHITYENDPLYVYVMPKSHEHPYHAYYHMLLVFRNTYHSKPRARYMVATTASGEIVGLAAWTINGQCGLADQWTKEHQAWLPGLQGKLMAAEQAYWRLCIDRSCDQRALKGFGEAMSDNFKGLHEYLCCIALIVHPDWQSKGIGKRLLRWGKEAAGRERLPVALSTSPVGNFLYRKEGFREYMVAKAPNMDVPILLWEPEGMRGRWLEEDDQGRTKLKMLEKR